MYLFWSIFSYVLEVLILGRHINDGIRTFMVSKHNNPICVHGQSRGDGADEYLQPAAIAIDHYKNLVSVKLFYDLESILSLFYAVCKYVIFTISIFRFMSSIPGILALKC